jgi:eukaryotic-like serine/threonine-protein kinase
MSSLSPSGNDIDETLAGDDSGAVLRRAPKLLARGESVGRYVVIDRIGQGGMGIVYAAYDPELDRKVAVKVLAPGPAGHTDGVADRIRLVREAQAMAKLAHPHVVPVHDAGTHEGSVFIAMEFVEGGTLAARMRARPPWEELLPLFLQAGTGLAAAHAAGLVHRDFKPDNVLLGRDGTAKVSDFGLARAVTPSETSPEPALRPAQDVLSSEITRVGAIMGTPAYMAPEQHLHQPTDARSDQFSFCVALYEALYGTRPFHGRSLSELVYAVTTGAVGDPPAGSRVPTRLRKVVLRGLAVDPAMRWPDMDELRAALRDGPTRRRGPWLALAAASVVVLGGLGTFAALERREKQRCRTEAGAARAIWTDEARTRVAEGLRATGMPYVEPSIERMETIVEPWVVQWTDAREEVCLAAARDPDDALVPLQRACLDERLVHFDVTLELLADDASIARSAVQAVASLPRLQPCDDARWLRQRADAMTAAASDPAAQLEVARLVALTRGQRPERARSIAQELLVATKDDPFLRAEVLRAIARLEERDVDPAAAVKHFEEAYFMAGRTQNDRTAALSAIDLTMLVGVRMRDVEKGRAWARHATMMVEREPDPELRHELLYVVGALESTAENDEAALAAFLEMAELANETFGPDHPETGFAHMALGNAYSGVSKIDQAVAEYELAHAIWARTLGPEHPTTITATFNLANLFAVSGRVDDALRLHREVLGARERIFSPGHIEIAESHSAVGDVLAWHDDFEGALAEHRRSLEIHQHHYGADSPRTWVEMDDVVADLLMLDRAAEAEPFVTVRCEAAETARTEQPDAWVRCLTHRAELAQVRDELDAAVSLFAEALGNAEKFWGADHFETRWIRYKSARTLLRAGQVERARDELQRIVSEWDASGEDTHPQLRDALGQLGRALARTGDEDGARRAFERALALTQAHGGSEAELAERRRDLEGGHLEGKAKPSTSKAERATLDG